MQWTIDPLHGWLHVGLTLIVDDRNVLVADFAQFWAIAKVYPLSIVVHLLCALLILAVLVPAFPLLSC